MNDATSPCWKPESIAVCCDLLSAEADRPQKLFPRGGGTRRDFGRSATSSGITVDTTGLDRVVDYPSEDLTITVEAGIRCAELSRLLATKGQMLPLDVADPERSTLGGALATNASGPRRLGFGTARDMVLGLDVVDATGQRVHGGGRVVKNVAGYDMPKLHIGALGTLGIIVEVSLKLRPLPEARAAIVLVAAPGKLRDALTIAVQGELRPVGAELLNRAAAEQVLGGKTAISDRNLVLLFEECREAVDYQIEVATRGLGVLGETHVISGGDSPALLATLTGWFANAAGDVGFKATLRPSDVATFFDLAEKSAPVVGLSAQAGNGVVWGMTKAGDAKSANALLAPLLAEAVKAGGNLIVPRAPDAWKAELPVWGAARADRPLMEKLRLALDPERRINPGRFLVD
ncbi:MAG TPA: FAD-binding oxidoreductase [Planctomycetia bacterium]|nr:FAD-binding oxidoreductase [Planctomycetia bacterium]